MREAAKKGQLFIDLKNDLKIKLSRDITAKGIKL
jgi:hypothetical protein